MACCSECDTTIGDFTLPRVYTSVSDVDALKDRLDPEFRATDASIAGCLALEPGERAAWADFYKAWRKYKDTSTRAQVFCFDAFALQCVGTGTVYEDGLERERRLREWQQKVIGRCNLDAPAVDDPRKRTEVDTGWIKWAAGAVAVVGIAYTLGPILRGLGKR